MSGKTIRFLCLDDKPDEVKSSLFQLQNANSRLAITCDRPISWPKQLADLKRRINGHEIDGLLLDLRLDQSAAKNAEPVDYVAQLLASNLRTEMADAKLEDIPIVLWSINKKLTATYDRDISSHDLFDLVLDKDNVLDQLGVTSDRITALVSAYQSVSSELKTVAEFWRRLLSVPKGCPLDPRIGARFEGKLKKTPVHALVRFILRKFILQTGPLVDAKMLCAKLGVEYSTFTSSKLSTVIDKVARYKGPLGDAWVRWWWPAVELWWEKKAPEASPILMLSARDRIAVFHGLGYSDSQVANSIGSGYSERFNTICASLERPLDSLDGFMLESTGLEPWNERPFISRQVAVRPGLHRFKGKLDALENERLKALKAETKVV